MSLSNFWKNNKNKLDNNYITPYSPVFSLANSAYNYITKPRAKSTVWQGPLQPPKPTYSSSNARSTYNQAKQDMDMFKARQSQLPSDKVSFLDELSKLHKGDTEKDDGKDKSPSLVEKYIRDIQRIQAGNFKYSSTEKKQLENLRATGRQAELRQSRVNENYMGGTLEGELRSGRSRYAQEMADDAMINAMQTGTDAINDLDLQTSRTITELEQSIKEERLRAVAEKYGLLQEQDKQRSNAYSDLQERLLKYATLQNTILNQSRASEENDYNLAVSQGYRGSYRDFRRETQSNKSLGTRAPRSGSSSVSPQGGGLSFETLLSKAQQ